MQAAEALLISPATPVVAPISSELSRISDTPSLIFLLVVLMFTPSTLVDGSASNIVEIELVALGVFNG